MIQDFDSCYRAVSSRDERFDGWFFTGVLTTGIYCRPSCPAITPKRHNVRFFATAAAAQVAGLRACKRCRPDATPGSPEWNARADSVGRAMRLIGDGIVDREGVAGLAKRLHFSERHLHRQLVSEVGAGPQAIARAQRAETARILIETTRMKMSDIAFAAGFASIRQFNDTIREVFASTPRELRRARGEGATTAPATLSVRLPYRAPFDGDQVLGFLGERAVPGIESWDGQTYRRSLRLPNGEGVLGLSLGAGHVRCELALTDLRDLTAAVSRARFLLDLDADPTAVSEVLSGDRRLRGIVRSRPGLRVPGSVDGTEIAVRAVLGQQVSVKGARTLAARLVTAYGEPLERPHGDITHVFPNAESLAEASLTEVGMPETRRGSLRALTGAIAAGDLVLDRGADRAETRSKLLAIRGIGPWTASYLQMRALRDPDAFLAGDLGVVKGARRLGIEGPLEDVAERWRPWRAYAVQYLWEASSDESLSKGDEHAPSKSR